MIEPSKSRWFNAWFARHARGRIRRNFGNVFVSGLEETRSIVARSSMLLVANHTTWWDALVALYVSELLVRCDGYAMMDAANLKRLPFFRRVGAFGVDLTDPSDGARAMRYAVRLLGAPGRALWIFPQGRERSPFEPFGSSALRPGAAQIARLARRAVVLPVGLRYAFGGAERPDLWVSIGAPIPRERDVAEGVVAQRSGIDRELTRIGRAISARAGAGDELGIPEGFDAVMTRAPSLLGQLAERLLVRMLPS